MQRDVWPTNNVKHVLVSLCRFTTNTLLHFFVFVLACLCVTSDDQALRVYIFLFVFMHICSHFVQSYEQIKYGRTCGKTKANSNKNSSALICPRKPQKNVSYKAYRDILVNMHNLTKTNAYSVMLMSIIFYANYTSTFEVSSNA